MTPCTKGLTALVMVATLSGCSGFRTKTIRGDALPSVLAAARRDARSNAVALDVTGKPIYVSTGFHSVEIRKTDKTIDNFPVPLSASFDGPQLVVQTWDHKYSYSPEDVDRVRLRYEQASWSRTVGMLSLVAGSVTSVTGLFLAFSGLGGGVDAGRRGVAGLGMFFGGIGLQAVGIVTMTAGAEADTPVWAAQKPAGASVTIGPGGVRGRF